MGRSHYPVGLRALRSGNRRPICAIFGGCVAADTENPPSTGVNPKMQLFQQIDSRIFVYRVDNRGRLCYVNTHWLDFAAENDWPVTAAEVLGKPLMASVSDPQLRYLYGLLMARLRDGAGPFRFPYRCDAPDCRRYMRMEMLYCHDAREIEFRSQIRRIERRTTQDLLDARHPTDQRELDICSSCKRVSTCRGWMELEDSVISLRLFDCDRLPRTRHCLCPGCASAFDRLASGGGSTPRQQP